MSLQDTEMKTKPSDGKEELRELLSGILGKGDSGMVARATCLKLALQLPHIGSADEAIRVSEAFRKYIEGEAK